MPDITIARAIYPDVPSIVVPKSGSGSAEFFFTGDATATASDVASGKTFYGANGLDTGTATGGSISVVETPDAHGGTIVTITAPADLQDKTVTPTESEQTVSADYGYAGLGEVTVNPIPSNYHDMSGSLAWMGVDAELVKTYPWRTFTLAQTDFATWTPSTTAQVILASSTLETFVASNMDTYNYYLVWESHLPIEYTGSPANKAKPLLLVGFHSQVIIRRPSSWANIGLENFNSQACITDRSLSFLRYYNAPSTGSPTLTFTWATSYGFYCSATAASVSNSTTASPTITPKTPTLTARCSNTYMSTANAALIDQTNSVFTQQLKVYRVKAPTQYMGAYSMLVDFINSGTA